MRSPIAVVVVAAAAFAALLAAVHFWAAPSQTASSDEPGLAVAERCAKAVLSDWSDDGVIDRRYGNACYERALDHIPESSELVGPRLRKALENEIERND